MADAGASKPFWAKCQRAGCGHIWAAAYYPLDAKTFARILARAVCPKCGDRHPTTAKQDNGELQEPAHG